PAWPFYERRKGKSLRKNGPVCFRASIFNLFLSTASWVSHRREGKENGGENPPRPLLKRLTMTLTALILVSGTLALLALLAGAATDYLMGRLPPPGSRQRS